MFKNNILLLVLITFIFIGALPASAVIGDSSLTASEYQDIIGRGMATSWLKTDNNSYSLQALQDIKARGFNNVRIRTFADVYTTQTELSALVKVVDDCIVEGIVPIISWINHDAEDRGNDTDRTEYIQWWTNVAKVMADKSHLLSFNLFTELGGGSPIRQDVSVYNDWTRNVVDSIRAISPTRMIILSAPAKNVGSLVDIDPTIYQKDKYMMAEWHLYASGPNKKGGQKNWVGNGSPSDRENVTSIVNEAVAFTNRTNIPTYFGAWMPMDNQGGSLTPEEITNFCNFFLNTLSDAGLPWSVNALDQYYDKKNNTWKSEMSYIVDLLVTVGDFGITGLIDERLHVAPLYLLGQNYPNPFNPSTKISYQITRSDHVTLKVYNLFGQEMTTLEDGFKTSGTHQVQFDAFNLSSGVYYYTLKTGNYKAVQKMLYLK